MAWETEVSVDKMTQLKKNDMMKSLKIKSSNLEMNSGIFTGNCPHDCWTFPIKINNPVDSKLKYFSLGGYIEFHTNISSWNITGTLEQR